MKIILKIEGTISTSDEKVEVEIEIPDRWRPSYTEYTKAIGAIRSTEDVLGRFAPPNTVN